LDLFLNKDNNKDKYSTVYNEWKEFMENKTNKVLNVEELINQIKNKHLIVSEEYKLGK
jgi:hypothetical protein